MITDETFLSRRRGVYDPVANRELELFAMNHGGLYRKFLEPLYLRMEARYRKEDYIFLESVKSYKIVVDYAAQAYINEHATPNFKVSEMFTSKCRWYVAYSIAKTHLAEMKIGNYIYRD